MATWIIEPRDPLIVRDGRPFGPVPGTRAASLAFPFPSTIIGGVRTRSGMGPHGFFDTSLISKVKCIGMRGPLLVELGETGTIEQWLCPAPADSLLFEDAGTASGELTPGAVGDDAVLRRLTPLKIPAGALMDLEDLAPVGLVKPDPRKPHGHAPRFWYWKKFLEWLEKPSGRVTGEAVNLADLGQHGPGQESRTHVSIGPETGTNVDGALFQTRGLEFTHAKADRRRIQSARRLALAIGVDSPESYRPREGLSPLGGERRLVEWKSSAAPILEPVCPTTVRNEIARIKACRMLLLTPAHFMKGSLPGWIGTQHFTGVIPHLKALSIGRPQVVSGWDYEICKPKPTRRLAPAGSVFFLQLEGTEEAIHKWIDAMWLHNVSDDPQDCLDGFGLAVLGAWDGKLLEME